MFNSDYCDEYGRYILTDETSDMEEQAYNIVCALSPFIENDEEHDLILILGFFDGDKCDPTFASTLRVYAIKLACKMCPSDCVLDWSTVFPNRLAYYKKGE